MFPFGLWISLGLTMYLWCSVFNLIKMKKCSVCAEAAVNSTYRRSTSQYPKMYMYFNVLYCTVM